MLNRQETACTYLALLPVVFGVVVSTKAELSFSTAGFAAAVAAAAARAFKSVLQVCVTSSALLAGSTTGLLCCLPYNCCSHILRKGFSWLETSSCVAFV